MTTETNEATELAAMIEHFQVLLREARLTITAQERIIWKQNHELDELRRRCPKITTDYGDEYEVEVDD